MPKPSHSPAELGTPEDRIPKDVLAKFILVSAAAEIPPGRGVLASYAVKEAKVDVLVSDGIGEYLVNEPQLTEGEASLYRRVMADLFFSLKPTEQQKDKLGYVDDFMDRYSEKLKEGFPAESRKKIQYYISRDVAGYGILDVPMSDPNVEEVECSGHATPVTVVHRDFTEYLRLRTNIRFGGEAQLGETVQKLVQKGGKSVTIAYPYSDFILPEGHRGAVTYSNEISLPGSTFDIRKFPADPLTITMLIRSGTMSSLMAAYEWMIQEQKAFTLITGAVSSGKTTMLNALLSTLHPAAKIFTCEDTPEMKVGHQNWVRMMTRSAYTLGAREMGLMELVKAALRYRPDYLIVGEVRGEEIQSLVQAAAVGHGALTTIHAESPQAAIVRMKSPPLSVGESFLLLIWSFVQMGRVTLPSGKEVRRVLSITELVPEATGGFILLPIFARDAATDSYQPTRAEEVVKKSERLKSIMELRGISERTLLADLKDRASLLDEMVKGGVFKYSDVASRFLEFYKNSRTPK